jgi:hypothetical protein
MKNFVFYNNKMTHIFFQASERRDSGLSQFASHNNNKVQAKTGLAAITLRPRQVAAFSTAAATTTPDDMPTNWKLLESLHNFEERFISKKYKNKNNNNKPQDMFTNNNILKQQFENSINNIRGAFGAGTAASVAKTTAGATTVATAFPDGLKMSAYQPVTEEEVYYDLPRAFGL